MTHKCAAYLLTENPTPELIALGEKFPQAAEYPDQNIVLFAETSPNSVDAVDASLLTTEELIGLISTHKTPNAVEMTVGQASAVYNILHVTDENELP